MAPSLAWSSEDALKQKKSRKPALSEVQSGISEMKAKIQSQDEQIGRLRAEVDTLRVQPHKDSVPALFFVSNQTYIKTGFTMIYPRDLTLNFATDDGLGAYVGVGQYIGRNHVIELSFDYDIYPALTIRYRFEIHPTSPPIAISPIIGYKIKLLNLAPLDDYLQKPDAVNSSFGVFGLGLGLPIAGSIFNVEFVYLLNSQAFLLMNLGIQFFI
jgi:hypothetical protein